MYVESSCVGEGGREEAMTTIVERGMGTWLKTQHRFKCRQSHGRVHNHTINGIVQLNTCCGLSMPP